MTNQALDKLRKLAKQESRNTGCHSDQAFDDIGLNLLEPAGQFGYDATPLHTSTFACTGGDGVHFSLVHIDGMVTDDSPVIMTVPDGFEHRNIVVGSNLIEFLCLGCEIGYFPLEQLAFQFTETVEWLKNPSLWHAAAGYAPDDSRLLDEVRLLAVMRREFSLRPWQKIEERLFQLQIEYLPWLEYGSEHLKDIQSLVISTNRNREK